MTPARLADRVRVLTEAATPAPAVSGLTLESKVLLAERSRHTSLCTRRLGWVEPCTCGLDARLAAIEAAARRAVEVRAREALRFYGWHRDECFWLGSGDPDDAEWKAKVGDWVRAGSPCQCGYSATLAALATGQPVEVGGSTFQGQGDWPCSCGHRKDEHHFGDRPARDGSFGAWCQMDPDHCHRFTPAEASDAR